ncbi:MAG TPA: FAD binding domain-containing protein [Solirubrobacteraceae bacterium]|nr:FAD binding domain-containing protein [Solirubrobacteraceae bacterium]
MTAEVLRATSAVEAVSLIGERGAVPLAGATWVMRAPLRGEPHADAYVALTGVDELGEIVRDGASITIGACVSHDALAAALCREPSLRGLWDAAATSATPAVRRMATVGGALGAAGFRSSDLLPALLALGAEVQLMPSPGERRGLPLEDYLRRHDERGQALVCAVRVPAAGRASAHRRLCMRRGGGDYPVAIISVAVSASGELRVGAGSVGVTPRRWHGLERALTDGAREPEAVRAAAEAAIDELEPRDGVQAPAWYRGHVAVDLAVAAIGEVS